MSGYIISIFLALALPWQVFQSLGNYQAIRASKSYLVASGL